MKLALLGFVAIPLIAALSLVVASRATDAGLQANGIVIDLDPSTAGTVESSRLVASGATFEFSLVAVDLITPYQGYQWQAQWPDAGLDFVSKIENSAATGASLCAGAVTTTDPGAGVPAGLEWIGQGAGCLRPSGLTLFSGELVRITARCGIDGTNQIDLVGLQQDSSFGTTLLGAGGNPIQTALGSTALLSCGAAADTPTLTPTDTATPTFTPIPPFTPSPTRTATATFTPCTPGAFCEPTPVVTGPVDVLMLEKSTCLATLTGVVGGPAIPCLDTPRAFDLALATFFHDVIGDADGIVEPEDFDRIDLDAGQLHSGDGFAFVLAFVDGDEPVTFTLPAGAGEFAHPFLDARAGAVWTCDTEDEDEDCDDDGIAGNGIVVAGVCMSNDALGCGGPPDFGPALPGVRQLVVEQEGVEEEEPFTVVGEPAFIVIEALEATVENGVVDITGDGDLNDAGECSFGGGFFDIPGTLLAESATPQRTMLIARVKDADFNDVTGGWVRWVTNDASLGVVTGIAETPSLDLGELGVGAPQVFCGRFGTGVVSIVGDLVFGPSFVLLDPNVGFGIGIGRVRVVAPPTPTPTATDTPRPSDTPTATPTPTPTDTPPPTSTRTPPPGAPCADVTGDGIVNFADVFAVVRHLGRKRFDPAYDVDGDGRVTGRDVALTIRQFGRTCDR